MRQRTNAELRAIFRYFAKVDFPAANAPMYAAIAERIADDDELLDLSSDVRPRQMEQNLLFAAVHQLLLSGAEHLLSEYYADCTPHPGPSRTCGRTSATSACSTASGSQRS